MMLSLAEQLALDDDNRKLALDTARSFIVQAPAGAGKTELLTQRFLALLAQVEHPEEIIALTFTNKAAAEMRDRVLSSLKSAAGGVPPEFPHKQKTYELSRAVLQIDRDKQWGLLEHAGRLQINTLDSLCGKLARQMPLLTRFGSQPAVSADSDRLYQQAVSNTLELLETDTPVAPAIARVLAYFDNDFNRLGTLLVSMLGCRDQWLNFVVQHDRTHGIEAAEQALQTLVEAELAALAASFPASLQESIMAAVRYAAAQAGEAQADDGLPAGLKTLAALTGWTQPLRARIEDLPAWRALVELLLNAKGEIRSKLPSGAGFSSKEGKLHAPALKNCLNELQALGAGPSLARLRKLPSPHYRPEERELIEHLIQILKNASAQLWLVFKEAQTVDFIQVAHNGLQAMGEEGAPSELQQRLDYQIKHLLVDEYQDTSPTQVSLLEKLTAGWEPGDGRTLFLVGDPMQSIYRFRKADVSLFLKARDEGLNSIKLQSLLLYRNNRSHQAVVDWVNRAFPEILAKEDNLRFGAVRYAQAAPTKTDEAGSGVFVHPIIAAGADDIGDEDSQPTPVDVLEAQKIITLIRQARQENPKGKIAILVRARTHLEALAPELRRHAAELPYQAVEIEALAARQSIQDLVALTRALFHRADRINWLAILRAPWCGLSLADLHQLAADDHHSTIWQLMDDAERVQQLSEEGQTRLSHLHQVMREAFQGQGRQRPRRWIEGVWQSLGGPATLRQASEWVDVQAYFELLDRLTRQGQLELNELDVELEKLFAAPNPLAGDHIQIMTIHKSKGLEFDTVILPGLHRLPKVNERRLLEWEQVLTPDGEERLLVAPVPPRGVQDDEPSKHDYLLEAEKTRSANETQRLLYVAVTRAIRQLHLIGAATPDPKEEAGCLRRPGDSTLLGLLWGNVGATFEAAAKSTQAKATTMRATDPASFISRLERLLHVAYPQALQADADQAMAAATTSTAAEDERVSAGSLEADTGTLVHRYLEQIALEGVAAWQAERLQAQRKVMALWFKRRGYPETAGQEAAANVAAMLESTLSSKRGQWILGEHAESGCEVALASQSNGVQQRHVVDRTFIENGVRWIIDYKTTRADLNDDALVAGKVAQYQAQLERYRQLFCDEGREIRCGLYFCGQDRFVEITGHTD